MFSRRNLATPCKWRPRGCLLDRLRAARGTDADDALRRVGHPPPSRKRRTARVQERRKEPAVFFASSPEVKEGKTIQPKIGGK